MSQTLIERIHAVEQMKSESRSGSVKSSHIEKLKSSIISVKTNASSSRSIRLEAAARTARLKTEMAFLKRNSEYVASS